jgi:hypothetical protein
MSERFPLEADRTLALSHDDLLKRLHGEVKFVTGKPGRFGCTRSYDFNNYSDAIIFAEIMRGRGDFHGEPCLWPTGKIRLVVSTGTDSDTTTGCDELYGPVSLLTMFTEPSPTDKRGDDG